MAERVRDLMVDVRRALRALRRAPGYAGTAVLAFAVGVAGAAVVASLLHTVLRPLPYPSADRLVAVWETKQGERRWVAPANYLDWRAGSRSFSALAAHDTREESVTVGERAERRLVAMVSGNFFDVVGVPPLLGRAFDPGLDTDFGPRLAVLSHQGWTEAFGRSPEVLGRTVRVADATYEIVGVMPPGLDLPDPGLFAWLRSRSEAPEIGLELSIVVGLRDAWYAQVLGRLADGVTLEGATAEMEGIAAELERRYPETNRDAGVRLVPLYAQTVAGSRPTLTALVLAVVVLLLAVVVDVGYLVMARVASRAGDRAVRLSLGATSGDLLRERLTETWLLAGVGAALGLGAADRLLAVGAGLVAHLPRVDTLALTPLVGVATFSGALLLGACVALLGARGAAVDTTLLRASRASGAGAPARKALIGVQIAASVALLASTGLVVRSVASLASTDPGFEAAGLTTFRVAQPDAATIGYQERVAVYGALAARLRTLPGVESVGFGSTSPLRQGARAGVVLVGEPSRDDPPDASWQPVHPDWLDALGVPLLRGRMLAASDDAGAADVGVVNEAFARQLLDGRDPLATRVTIGLDGHDRPIRIVGVVGDTRTRGPAEPATPVLYRPVAQTDRYGADAVVVAVRSTGGAVLPSSVLRAEVAAVAPRLPVWEVATGDELLRPFRSAQTNLSAVLGAMAATALLLAMVGVYGVTAFGVRRRSREIGVRLALGAEHGTVVRQLVGAGMRTALIGGAVGLVVAVMVGRALGAVLVGVDPVDPPTLVAALAVVLSVALAALYLPSRRASRIDPAHTMREG